MSFLFYLLAVIIGCAVAVQGPLNAAASGQVGVGPLLIVSNTVVLLGSIPIYYLWPETARWGALSQVPLLHWGGAICGLTIVVGGMLVFPRLGPTTALGLILIGQFLLGTILEQRGWLGVPQSSLDLPKALGIALMLTGFLVTQVRTIFPSLRHETPASTASEK
jgi:transporter family-2 protein